MSVATGLAVAGNYYAQPLLPSIAAEMGISAAAAGSVVTTAQLGYALGLLLIVPLGDLLERRRLVVIMTLLAAAGLLVTALASGMAGIYVGTALAGLFSVVAQVLVPLAATLAAPERRGKVVGTVMSGLLLGILLARTVAGGLAGLGGWRTVYWVGAAAMALIALVLARCLPRYQQSVGLSYPQLLRSVLGLFGEEPALRLRAFLGATVFAAFSVLWTSMAFLLAGPDYGYGEAAIGLFGLAGAAGALAANAVGRLADGGRGRQATLGGLLALLLSWGALWFAPHSLAALVVGVLVLDLAVQGVHVSNQGALYGIRPDARNRLTAAYMTCYFIGGASGSLASAAAFQQAGWAGVCVVGALVSAAALAAWCLVRLPGEAG
jgi:predicted MFS family arabinose efflux permease